MSDTREQFVWCEKYRPQALSDCILPSTVKSTLEGVLAQGNMTNLLLAGKAGTGKTTVARALVRELQADALVINASEENGIDVLRTKIKDYATTLSFGDGRKYVILDEADYLHPASTQPALRAFMEEFSASCGFILTANYPSRIIAPLHSRCSLVDFKIPGTEKGKIATAMLTRCEAILAAESVKYNQKTVAEVVKIYFPDMRRILNELQRFSSTGTLSDAILSQMSEKDIAELFSALKSADYSVVRKWVALHDDMDAQSFYRMLAEQVPARVDSTCLAELIIQMADYSYRSAFAADQQLNALACLTEIMHSGKFK